VKLDSSTLFVNTGRKPLPAMQKKKKNSKKTIALIVCIAIIAVLCVFVGLIMHVWFNYNENVKPPEPAKSTVVEQAEPPEKVEPVIEEEPEEPVEEKPEPKPEKKKNSTMGEVSNLSKAVSKPFESVEADYSYGIANLGDGYIYIDNTDKLYNKMAVNAFLLDYVSNAIYLGTFDYDTPVGDYMGSYLMTRAFTDRSTEAAQLLINHFGTAKLNAYLESKGYTGTQFSDTDGESYTTSEDLIRLMDKMYKNTNFFPYSDMYKKMRNSSLDTAIKANLPEGCSSVNLAYISDEEMFEAGIIYTPNGNFAFVCSADSADDSVKTAISESVAAMCSAASKDSGDE